MKIGKKVIKCLCQTFVLGCGFFSTVSVKAEGDPIYYDTFYDDYYKAFPDAKPKKNNVRNTTPKIQTVQNIAQPTYYNGTNPYMQYQTTGTYNQTVTPYTSFYQKVDHDPKKWEIDIKYKKGEGQFMFLTDVESILNWDEMQTTQTVFSVSRDFMIKNRQYVFNFTYGTGDYSSDRTSDDDIYNDLHIISLGRGYANMKDMSASIGLRNFTNFVGFDVTPVIGYRRKQQDFEMGDHAVPAPFYLEYFCEDVAEDGVCDGGINLLDAGIDISEVEALDGGEVTDADMFIPGYVEVDGVGIENLYYGMQIADEDFIYVTLDGREMLLYADNINGGSNLLTAFGGVSSLYITEGITHMYHVTWEGPFIGVNLERMISPRQTLSLYGEFFKPSYEVWGNWPNRDDWAHDPSFIDDGGSAWGVSFDATYKYKIRNNIEITFGINYEYLKEKNADTTQFFADGWVEFYPNSILEARWKHYGIALGIAFKL